MAYVNCNDPDAPACLDALIKEINDDLTIGCQIPFTVPKNELARIINRAKDYFYKIYEDSVEEMYIALPASALKNINLRKKFCIMLQNLFDEHLVSLNAVEYFSKTYQHKLRNSMNPSFLEIWPD